jgi:hypothetical protein
MAIILSLSKDDADDGSFDGQHVQEFRDGDDLVGLLRHLDLCEHKTLAGGKGRNHVNGVHSLLPAAAPAGLAIDGDHFSRHAGLLCSPAHKTLLECLGIERGEHLAQAVMTRRCVHKCAKAPQQRKLLFPELGNRGEGLGASQHRQQGHQQTLIQRIDNLVELPRIRQINKMIQKNNAF